MAVCATPPAHGDLGVTGALLLAPESPALSVRALRMHALDVNRMPPLGSLEADAASIALVEAWIAAPDVCVAYPDGDADGVSDNVDNCTSVANADQQDLDHDGVGDRCDNCAQLVNADQRGADNHRNVAACGSRPTNGMLLQDDGSGAVWRPPTVP